MRVIKYTDNERRESHNLPEDYTVRSWIEHHGRRPYDIEIHSGYITCLMSRSESTFTSTGIKRFPAPGKPVRFEIYEHDGRPMSKTRIEHILSLPVRKLTDEVPCPDCGGKTEKCITCSGRGVVGPDPTYPGDIERVRLEGA